MPVERGSALNIKKGIFPADNSYGIPNIRKQDLTITQLSPFSSGKYNKDVSVHFFIDDYRFERVWNSPDSFLTPFARCEAVLTPDFSIYEDFPIAVQIWNVYRNRFLGAYWQLNGINVIPTIQWADERSYDFCFLGVETGSIVAISTVGAMNSKSNIAGYVDGFIHMMNTIQPSLVICYGKPHPCMEGYNIQYFKPFYSKFKEGDMSGRKKGKLRE